MRMGVIIKAVCYGGWGEGRGGPPAVTQPTASCWQGLDYPVRPRVGLRASSLLWYLQVTYVQCRDWHGAVRCGAVRAVFKSVIMSRDKKNALRVPARKVGYGKEERERGGRSWGGGQMDMSWSCK